MSTREPWKARKPLADLLRVCKEWETVARLGRLFFRHPVSGSENRAISHFVSCSFVQKHSMLTM